MTLQAPSNFEATIISPHEATFTWTNNLPPPYHFIEIWENENGGGYVKVDEIDGSEESYFRSGLTKNTPYCWKVRAKRYFPDETSDFSNEDCETTYDELEDPSDIVTTVFSNFIEITWKDNSSSEDVFCIERKVGAGSFSEIATVAANVEYYRDTSVSAGTQYTYRVRARQNPSNYSGYVTGSQVTSNSAPGQALSLTISEITDEEMRLTWQAPSSGGYVTGYKIEKSDTGVFGGEEEEIAVVDSDVLTLLEKDLSANTQYWFRVRAYNGVGNGTWSSTATDTTLTQYQRSDFEVFVRDPLSKPVYIAVMELKMDLSGFTLVSGKTYTYEVTVDERGLEFDYVWEDGGLLTKKTSITEVEANAGSWYWDSSARKLYVHAKDGTDPDNFFMEGEFAHKIPNRDFAYADDLCTLPPWLSADDIPSVIQEIKPHYEGSFRLSTGSISFKNGLNKEGEHYFDKRFEKFTWIGRKITLYCGKETFDSLSKFKTMFSAYISSKDIDDRKITLSLADLRKELERNLVLNKYWQSDYPDMSKDFEGREKPKALGSIENLAPIRIAQYDSNNNKSAKYHYKDGRSKMVGKVTVNEIEKTKDTDYYVDLQRSIITFDKSVDVGEDDVVRVSFMGEVNSADEPIENGADAFKHIMNNEANVSTSKLNTDWIYETKNANTKELSILIYKDTPFDEIAKNIEHTTEAYILQDGQARIGLRPLQTTVPSKAKYIWNFQSKGHKHSKDRSSLYWKVKVYYNEDPQLQEWEVKEATNNNIKWKFGIEKELPPVHCYFKDPSYAQTLANNILNLLNKTPIEDELPMELFDVFPGDLLPFSRDRFFDSNGTASEVTLRVLRTEKSPQTEKTKVKMVKV